MKNAREVKTREEKGVVIIEVAEQAEREYSRYLMEEVQRLTATHTLMVFDLKKTNYIDSLGLGALLFAWRKCKEKKGAMVIACANTNICNLIALINLEKRITLLNTVKEAVEFCIKNNAEGE